MHITRMVLCRRNYARLQYGETKPYFSSLRLHMQEKFQDIFSKLLVFCLSLKMHTSWLSALLERVVLSKLGFLLLRNVTIL